MFKVLQTGLSAYLLLPIVCGDLHVNVQSFQEGSDVLVESYGSDVSIISDQEMQTFRLSEWQLKKASKKVFDREPDNVYVKDPTPPYGNIYKLFGWKQITRTLIPKRTTVLERTYRPVIVARNQFINNSTKKTKYNAGITQQVQDTVTNSWTKGGELSVGASISYNMIIGFGANFEYRSRWGSDTSKSQSFMVGSSSGVEIELDPGQAAVTTLTATRGYLRVRIDYSATLSGYVAPRYYYKHRGHNNWAFTIDHLRQEDGFPGEIESSEEIRIGFYSDIKVVVSDMITNETVSEEKAQMLV